MYYKGDSTYSVDFYVYQRIENGNFFDFPENHYDHKENWGDHKDMSPVNDRSGSATIKKGSWNGQEVWNLVSYNW